MAHFCKRLTDYSDSSKQLRCDFLLITKVWLDNFEEIATNKLLETWLLGSNNTYGNVYELNLVRVRPFLLRPFPD